MKKQYKIRTFLLVLALMTAFSCEEEFFDRPPEDSFNAAGFYQTTEEVEVATRGLYLRPWFDFISNTAWVIGEIASGNARTYDPRNADFVNFAVNSNHQNVARTWTSLYAVVAQSNAIINTLPGSVGAQVPQEVVDNAIGEARFMRAIAYFYLVRIYGSVPIIANNTEAIQQLELERNPIDDVYRFITLDLEFAIDNCFEKIRSTSNYIENAHVTSGSAKALLAKVYLYQEDYTMAYQLADEVISSGEFKLFGGDAEDGDPNGSYYGLFQTANDNNPESIFAIQWGTSGQFAEGNSLQSLFAQAGLTGFADGWGALGPSLDLQEAYEDNTQDVRFYATIQAPGAFYPDINGGYTTAADIDLHDTKAGVKKYVIGTPDDDGGGAQQSYPNNTYILRYGELLLIHAEAAIMGGGSTAQGTTSFNKVRRRAGLNDIINPTIDDIFEERRIELAFEFEFWYDVVRRGEAFAVDFLSNTERGIFTDTDPPQVDSRKFAATADDLLYPYPTTELQKNPGLSKEPVPYNFDN